MISHLLTTPQPQALICTSHPMTSFYAAGAASHLFTNHELICTDSRPHRTVQSFVTWLPRIFESQPTMRKSYNKQWVAGWPMPLRPLYYQLVLG